MMVISIFFRSENAVKNRWNSAQHTRARRARLDVGQQPQWDEVLERKAVMRYCKTFTVRPISTKTFHQLLLLSDVDNTSFSSRQESSSIADFIPWVMAELQMSSPIYDKVDCLHLSKIHRRLRSFLDTEARMCPSSWSISKVFAKRKKRPVAAGTTGGGLPAACLGKERGSVRGDEEEDVEDEGSSDMMVVQEEDDMGSSLQQLAAAAEQKKRSEGVTRRKRARKSPSGVHRYAEEDEEDDDHMRMHEEQCNSKYYYEEEGVAGRFNEAMSMSSSSHPSYYRGTTEEEDNDDDESIGTISSSEEEDKLSSRGRAPVGVAVARPIPIKLRPSASSCFTAARKISLDHQPQPQQQQQAPMTFSSKSSTKPRPHPVHKPHQQQPQQHMAMSHHHHQQQQQQQQAATSNRMREVISLLFSSMRTCNDPSRRELYQEALDAATQENPAMVNYVEGVLGCGMAVLDLDLERDRDYLRNSLLDATRRGVFSRAK